MKIMDIRLSTIICPAVIFAKRRIIRAKGLVNIPIISTGIIIGASQTGTPGVLKICCQYPLFPLRVVMRKVMVASTKVTAILPVTLGKMDVVLAANNAAIEIGEDSFAGR